MTEHASHSEDRPPGARPRRSGSRGAGVLLCASIALLAVGYAWKYWVAGSPLFSVLWMNADWSESAAQRADRFTLGLLLVAAIGTWLRSKWAAWIVVAILGLWTGLAMHSTESFWSWLPASRATRWAAPIVLWCLWSRRGAATTLLRWAAAATFCAHGVKALALYPPFLDLLFASAVRSGFALDPVVADRLLQAIGAIDVVIAMVLVVPGRRRGVVFWVAAYMAVWGLVTALSRILHSGLGGVPEALIRAPNAGVPAALVALWWGEFRGPGATPD